jgi:integrase/recombinase XerD
MELRKLLFLFDKKRPASKFFFSTKQGVQLGYRNTYRDVKAIWKRAGVEGAHIHPHAMRHCFAVNYIRKNKDIYRLSRILGHASITTTQLYVRSMGIEQIAEEHSTPLAKS